MDEIKTQIIVGDDNLAAFVCPECEFLSIEDVTECKDKVVHTECNCGHTYTVSLERRKFYRKTTNLNGICSKVNPDIAITVTNLSLTGIQFKLNKMSDLKIGDEFYAEFDLDDERRSKVIKKVIIKSIDGLNIGAQFVGNDQGSRMTPYLYYK